MTEISLAQQNFLLAQKRHKRSVRTSRLCIFLLFFGLWEVASQSGLIDSFIFSSPSKLFLCAYGMILDHTLFTNIGITLFETIVSFLLVIFFALFITIILWFNKHISETLEPYLVVLNSLPKSALAPLLIVWLGANYNTIIITGMSVAIFGSILSLYNSFQSVDTEKVKLIYTLGGNKFHVLTKVVLPSSLPSLFSIMKVNIGLCLVGVIIGEFIAARAGLGYLIIYGSQVFKLDWVILSIAILCIIAIALYQAIAIAEKYCLKHH
ncbi:ABC transporter permease [Roseburia sp. MSJ-14]|uniref:ABC transporter permease n=1 Tax=Roseburia sp. MSJ-14 TaxID=2841514 RepID=UPI001C126B9C|nr:ABC transporter permease [Roseburia sp. MSJ-14]MBU5472615.1 ABC transporter permease [Roseburia sp. MSJ-14]